MTLKIADRPVAKNSGIRWSFLVFFFQRNRWFYSSGMPTKREMSHYLSNREVKQKCVNPNKSLLAQIKVFVMYRDGFIRWFYVGLRDNFSWAVQVGSFRYWEKNHSLGNKDCWMKSLFMLKIFQFHRKVVFVEFDTWLAELSGQVTVWENGLSVGWHISGEWVAEGGDTDAFSGGGVVSHIKRKVQKLISFSSKTVSEWTSKTSESYFRGWF